MPHAGGNEIGDSGQMNHFWTSGFSTQRAQSRGSFTELIQPFLAYCFLFLAYFELLRSIFFDFIVAIHSISTKAFFGKAET